MAGRSRYPTMEKAGRVMALGSLPGVLGRGKLHPCRSEGRLWAGLSSLLEVEEGIQRCLLAKGRQSSRGAAWNEHQNVEGGGRNGCAAY